MALVIARQKRRYKRHRTSKRYQKTMEFILASQAAASEKAMQAGELVLFVSE